MVQSSGISLFFGQSNETVMVIASYTNDEEEVQKLIFRANALMNSYDVTTTVIMTPVVKQGIIEYDTTHQRNYKIVGIPLVPSDAPQLEAIRNLINVAITIKDVDDYKLLTETSE